jgi:hypothetical protein
VQVQVAVAAVGPAGALDRAPQLGLEIGSARRRGLVSPDSDFALASANRLALDTLCGRSWPSRVSFLVRRGFGSRRFGACGMLLRGMASESWRAGSNSRTSGF